MDEEVGLKELQAKLNELCVKVARLDTAIRAYTAEQQRCNNFVDRDLRDLKAAHKRLTERCYVRREECRTEIDSNLAGLKSRFAAIYGGLAVLITIVNAALQYGLYRLLK